MTASEPFPSLPALREAHVELLRHPRDHRDTPEFRTRVEEFMARAQATGRLLDEGPDRSAAQTVLDYWASFLYRDSPEQLLSVALAPCEEAPAESILPDSACPYRELYATGIDTGRFFFGRSRLVDELSKLLESSRFVAVVGPSGSGKRSLVLAGLVPALARQAKSAGVSPLPNFVLTPGFQPFENLARVVPPDEDIRREALALKEDAGRLTAALDAVSESPSLLIVDRFEEVFAEECLQSDQAAFANSLADLVRSKRGHRLVLILDSEFASETKKLGPLAELFERATFDVPLLSAGDLREIIVRPAELVGLHIDPAVVDRLVNDVAGDPSALALVQYALEWLWKKRTGNRIPASAYDELGSAQRAFSLAADAIFLQMDEDQREVARQVFLHLVRMEPSGRVVARGASRKDLLSSLTGTSLAELNAVLEQLVREQLLRQDQSGERFDVATKGLVTRWPTLMHWLDTQRQSREKRAWLTLAAKQWSENGRLQRDLLRARALKSARLLPPKELSPREREFIRESRAAAYRRRQKWIAAALVLVILVLLGLYWRHVELKETLARMMLERGERQLEARDPAGAALWFQEAMKEAVFNKQVHLVRIGCALRQVPTLFRLQPRQGLVNAEFNADGRRIVLAARKQDNSPGGAWLWNLDTSSTPELARDVSVSRAVFSLPAGGTEEFVATAEGEVGAGRGTVRIWKVQTQTAREEKELKLTEGAPADVAFDPVNPNVVAIGTASEDVASGAAYLWHWDTNDLKKLPTKNLPTSSDQGLGTAVNTVAFSRNGKWFAVGCGAPDSNAGEARVYSAAGELLAAFPHQWPVMKVDFDSEGEQLVTASGSRSSAGGEARIYKQQAWADTILPKQDAPNQTAPLRIVTLHHDLGVVSAKFNPLDSRLVLTASNDGTAKVWDAIMGRELAVLQHEAGVFDAGWSPDGRFVITGGRDRTARVWEALTGQLLIPQLDAGATAVRTMFSPTRQQVLVATRDRALLWGLWPRGGLRTGPILTDGSVTGTALSPDGSWLAVATLPQDQSQRGVVQIMKMAKDGAQKDDAIIPPIRLGGIVQALAFDPAGAHLAIATEDRSRRGGEIHVWDVLGQRPEKYSPLRYEGGAFTSVGFNEDDGSRILAVSRSQGKFRIHLWQTVDGKPLLREPLAPKEPIRTAAISPDGKLVAAVGGTLRPRAGIGYLWAIGEKEPFEQRQLNDEEEITCVAFSADGNFVVTGSADDEVIVWKTATAKRCFERTMKHTADVTFVAFSPGDSGRRILSGGMDGTVAVWDASDGSQIAQLRYGGSIRHGAFSPKDGRFVITGGEDQFVRVWDVGPGKRKGLQGLTDKLVGLLKRAPADPVAVLPFGAIPNKVGFTADGQTVFAHGVRFPTRLDDVLATRGAAAAPAYDADSRVQLPRLLHLRRWQFTPAEKNDDDLATLVAGRKVEQGTMDILQASDWTERWEKRIVSPESEFKPDDARSSYLRGARYAAAARHWTAARWHLDQALKLSRPDGSPASPLDPEELLLSAKANSELRLHDGVISDTEAALNHANKPLGNPMKAEFLRLQSEARAARQEWMPAIDALSLVEELNGPDGLVQIRLAELHIANNNWSEAVRALEKSREIELDPRLPGGPQPRVWQRLASAYLICKKDCPGKYEEACHEMLKKFGATDEFAAMVVWPWLLREDFPDRDEPSLAGQLCEMAERSVSDDPKNYYRLNTLGVLHYRQGNYEKAIARLEESCRAHASEIASRRVIGSGDALEKGGAKPASLFPDGRPVDWIFLAMAKARLAQSGVKTAATDLDSRRKQEAYDTEARNWLAQAREKIEGTEIVPGKSREFWDRLEMELFLAEAERVCQEPVPSNNP